MNDPNGPAMHPGVTDDTREKRLVPISTIGWLSCVVFGLFLLVTLVIMLFVSEGMDYPCKREFLLSNKTMLAFDMVVVLVVSVLMASKLGQSLLAWLHDRQGKLDRVVAIATLVLLLAQIVWCHSYVFITGWDSGGMVWSSLSLARREGFHIQYYSTYPNNLLLLRFGQLCMRITMLFGATGPESGVFLYCICNCISCNVALWLVYWILRRIANEACALVGWFMGVLLMWTSPWAVVFYSDAISVAVPPMLVALAMIMADRKGWKAVVAGLLFGLVAGFGYRVKPQLIFPLLALVIPLAARLVRTFISARNAFGETLRTAALGVVTLVLGMALSSAASHAATHGLQVCLDKNAQFGPAHFLMMGLNPESRGIYSQDDVNFSYSFDNPADRTKGDLEVAKNRVIAYGPVGLAHLYLDKLMIDYNDGTFAWGQEGTFWSDAVYGDDVLAPLTQSLYYDSGSRYLLFKTHEQTVWIGLLALCIAAALLVLRGPGVASRCMQEAEESAQHVRDMQLFVKSLVALTLVELSTFELIFEARARYFYAFVALFVLFGALGLSDICSMLRDRVEARNRRKA